MGLITYNANHHHVCNVHYFVQSVYITFASSFSHTHIRGSPSDAYAPQGRLLHIHSRSLNGSNPIFFFKQQSFIITNTYTFMSQSHHFETLQLHAGHTVDKDTNSRAVPIYQTVAYNFDSSQHASDLFSLSAAGNIYTRLTNPTVDVLEKRLAALEGGVAALATSSGHAAQFLVFNNLCAQGDNFVTSPYLYGGSYNQFKNSFATLGIEARFAKSDRAEDLEVHIDGKTKAIYVETIGNPGFSVPDFDKLSALSTKYGIPLVVDIVVASTTKWIGGHGTSMGGIIVDGGTFHWDNPRFPQFTQPAASYHGLKYWEALGNLAFIVRARVEGMRDYGPCQSPFNAFLLLQGIETLSLLAERHAQNTLALAEWLENHPKVESVNYPGLSRHPFHDLAKKYLSHGFGGVLTFTIKGSLADTAKFVDSLKVVSHLANVGDSRTLIIQPANTTHQQLTPEARKAAGVSDSLLRVSVGIEHIDDIKADFEQAFAAI